MYTNKTVLKQLNEKCILWETTLSTFCFSVKGKRKISLKTPDKCDPMLSFDAVTGMQQELVFFKDR